MKLYYDYYSKVLNDEITVGETIKLAYKRFQSDLKRNDLVFREDKLDRAIAFISTLKHFTDKHSGKPFILENTVYNSKYYRFLLKIYRHEKIYQLLH